MAFLDRFKTPEFKAKAQTMGDTDPAAYTYDPRQAAAIAQTRGEREGVFKAYIPNFLYKPPYGMPRMENLEQFKQLSKNAYVFSIIKAFCDEAASAPWEIKVKEEFADDGNDYSEKIKEITRFFNDPNGNAQGFGHILRKLVTDILEVDSGVIVKVFNQVGEFKQMFVRDGATFLMNPDIYGYMGNRQDFVPPLPDGFEAVNINFGGTPTATQQQMMKNYNVLYRENAAYFQYGWTAGSMPVPFGNREIVYIMQNPRGDSIYGRSPIQILTTIINNLVYGSELTRDFYEQNNIPDGAISLLGGSDKHVKQFRENMDNQFRFKDNLGTMRKRFFKAPIATTKVEFTPFQLSAKEMEIIAQQQWFTKILWVVFGITADFMGFTEDSSKNVSEEQVKNARKKAIFPLLDTIGYHLNCQVMPEFFTSGKEAPDFNDVPLEFCFPDNDLDTDIKERTLQEQEIRMGVKTPEMVAKDIGVNMDELEESMIKKDERDLKMAAEQAVFGGNPNVPGNPANKNDTGGSKKEAPAEKPEKVNNSTKKEEKVEKKAIDPLNEIEDFFDTMQKMTENLVE